MDQHFLISAEKISLLMSAAGIQSGDTVLECGAGMGTISQHVPPCHSLTLVELDPTLCAGLRDRFHRADPNRADPNPNRFHRADHDYITVHEGDALAALECQPFDVLLCSLPFHLTPLVLQALRAAPLPYKHAVLCVEAGEDLSPYEADFLIRNIATLDAADFLPLQPFASRAVLLEPRGRECLRVGLIADTQYCLSADAVTQDFDYEWVQLVKQDDTGSGHGMPESSLVRKLTLGHPHTRRYAHSLAILQRCVDEFCAVSKNTLKCCVHMGDVIDKRARLHPEYPSSPTGDDVEACKMAILGLTERVGVDWHYLVGNNDLQVMTRQQWVKDMVPMSAKAAASNAGSFSAAPTPDALYYSTCPAPGFRLVFLDGFDVSKLPTSPAGSFSASSADTDAEAAQFLRLYQTISSNDTPDEGHKYKDYNGAIGATQLAWLSALLCASDAATEKVFVFCHLPIFPGCCRIDGLLWNNETVLQVLRQSRSCQAFFAGHDHTGGYCVDDAGIHHFVLPAPLEARIGGDAFGHLVLHDDHFRLVWRGDGPRGFTLGAAGWPEAAARLRYR